MSLAPWVMLLIAFMAMTTPLSQPLKECTHQHCGLFSRNALSDSDMMFDTLQSQGIMNADNATGTRLPGTENQP